MGHFSGTHNVTLSEGRALAVVVWDVPETPHQTRDNTDFPRSLRKSEARLRFSAEVRACFHCPPIRSTVIPCSP